MIEIEADVIKCADAILIDDGSALDPKHLA